MTPRQLEALRKHLHFTVPEAARWVAADAERPRGVEERTWNRWEAGKVAIPANIAGRIVELYRLQRDYSNELFAQHYCQATKDAPAVLIWYDYRDDWPGDPAHWRPMQSAIAELIAAAAMDGDTLESVRLVPFDAQSFNRWRGARPDTAAERTAWASQQPDDTPPPRMVEMRKAG